MSTFIKVISKKSDIMDKSQSDRQGLINLTKRFMMYSLHPKPARPSGNMLIACYFSSRRQVSISYYAGKFFTIDWHGREVEYRRHITVWVGLGKERRSVEGQRRGGGWQDLRSCRPSTNTLWRGSRDGYRWSKMKGSREEHIGATFH